MPYKEGSKWRAQVMQNGKKLTRVFLTKKEAIQWEVSIKHNEPCQPADQKTDTVSLLEWTNQYLDFAKAKYVDKVYKEKVFVFRLFFESKSPQIPASFLTHKQVLDHLSKQASSRSGYASNKDRKNLVAAWNWGIKYLGLPNMNPFLVDRLPEKRSPRHVPPERDFWECGRTG